MRQRSKAQLLQDIKIYEGMKKDEAKGSNIRGSVVYWRMSVQWYVTLRDLFGFSDDEIQRILGLITKKDIYNMPAEKKDKILKLIWSKGCDCEITNLVSKRNIKNNIIAESVRSLENYNADISINYCLLMFDYLIRYQKFDKVRLDAAISEISYLDICNSDKIWMLREKIYDDTGFWIALDREAPEDAYHLTFNQYSKKTIGM